MIRSRAHVTTSEEAPTPPTSAFRLQARNFRPHMRHDRVRLTQFSGISSGLYNPPSKVRWGVSSCHRCYFILWRRAVKIPEWKVLEVWECSHSKAPPSLYTEPSLEPSLTLTALLLANLLTRACAFKHRSASTAADGERLYHTTRPLSHHSAFSEGCRPLKSRTKRPRTDLY